MELAISLVIIAGAVAFMLRGSDVRLVLFLAGLAMTMLMGQPWLVLETFRQQMAYGDTIGPICSAVGYAYVLRATGCDREMVRLLIKPIRRIRWLLVPGGCVIGFITNLAITSQTGAAAAVGPVLAPLMLAAGLHPIIVAATLVLGCSAGGNLLNPGDADLVAIQKASEAPMPQVLQAMWPPLLVGGAVAFAAFTWLSRREPGEAVAAKPFADADESQPVNLVKALMPPLPVVMIVAMLPGANLVRVDLELYAKGLPVAHAMLIASIVVLLVSRREATKTSREFFEGMGYAYANIITLIIAASCFVTGLTTVGLTDKLVSLVHGSGALGKLASLAFPGSLGLLSGSGMGSSVAFSYAVLPPLRAADLAGAVDLGVLGAIGASWGRTMSPVAAIVIFTSSLLGVTPLQIVRRTAPPLFLGAVPVLVVMWLR